MMLPRRHHGFRHPHLMASHFGRPGTAAGRLLRATAGDSPAERPALVQAIRAGLTDAPPPPMAVEMAAVAPFAAGSATPPPASLASAIAWARGAARDPRTRVELVGATDPHGDTDVLTGSAPLLATDRARTVAAALVHAGAVRPDQITIAAASTPLGRGVQLRLGFSGSQEVTR